ncbi:MAG: putative Ig domain-containing protein [Nitrospirae bacterium]|nr:putative Ig domain-containing protein [Nitrospirota bacterium]
MATTVEYALMAGRAYQITRGLTNQFPTPQGWAELAHVPNNPAFPQITGAAGFEAVAFRKGTDIVISYAGTYAKDIAGDIFADIGLATGVGSAQLLQAAEYYLQVKADNPNATSITFTGHSLGGGLAALMGVFFGQQAVTFDQAPFARSAKLNVLTPDIAANLKVDLLANGHTEVELSGLTNFLQLREANGDIPNSNLVTNINVQGELLSGVPYNIPDRIGTTLFDINNSASGVSGDDLHAQSLLTAFLQSNETAVIGERLNEVTGEFTDLLKMLFDKNLFANDTDTNQRNFLDHLVRHQVGVQGLFAADAMVTRFTSDLWKLAQDGGLTMSEGTSFFGNNLNNVSNTLIAFDMQKYYDEHLAAGATPTELFTDLTTAGLGSNGIHFDTEAVVGAGNPITGAKGYSLYFQDYLNTDAFSGTESQLMELLLPSMRDWYVQAGTSGMNATVIDNRSAFMLGGAGADTLTGGTRADLLVGNAGADTLDGGAGADTMIGGSGDDTYNVDNVGDQVIEGLNNGIDTVQSSVTFTFSPGDNLEHLTLTGTNNIKGIGNDLNNDLTGNSGVNRLEGRGGTDHLIGNGGTDILVGGTGDDRLEGGAGFDTYVWNTGDGNETIMDSDGIGAVTFNARLLSGGLRTTTDPQDTWHSADGAITYVKQGADLSINGTVTIEAFDFAAGDVGIRLTTAPDTTQPALPTIDFTNGQPTITWEGDDSNNTPLFEVGANHIAYGRGGFDQISFITYPEFYNHQVFGGLGNDTVDGGAGRDRLYGEGDLDVLRGWLGDDLLDGGDGDDELQGGTGNDQIFGGTGNDAIIANNPFNPLQSGSDNDYVDGGLGADFIAGGQGNDVLLGGAGDDTISGEGVVVSGRLDRQTGNDYLDGGAGNDGLTGGAGNDIVLGGTGDDLLNGDNEISLPENPSTPPEWDPLVDGQDYLDGGDGNDVLHGGGYDDILIGGLGNDRLWGDGFGYGSEPGDDWLDGGADHDELYGGAGADTLLGGGGDDLLVGDFSTDPGVDDILDGGAGMDELQGSGGNDHLFGGTEADLLFGEAGEDVLDGGQGADELQGGDGNDVLIGGTEDDRLFGDAGSDNLDGEAGADLLVGDAGDDTLFGGEGNDQLEGGVGADLLAGEDGNDVLIGGADADFLFGGDSNDNLQGGAGDDVLTGGAGVDSLDGGAGSDTYVFNLGDGVETIVDTAGEANKLVFGAGILADDISVGIGSLVLRVGFTGDAIIIQGFDPAHPTVPVGIETFEFADGTTLTQADLVARGYDLVGTAGNDSLNGGEIYREIYGLDGNDVLSGGAIDNVLNGGSGHDVLFGEGGIDQLLGGTGDDFMRGGDGNDVLNGEAGNDSLEGETGDDVLVGGAGDDQLLGGTGDDTYRFNFGDGLDSISDSIDVGEPNRVLFGPGITSSSVTLTTNFGQVLVRPDTAFEGVTIGANGSDALGFHAVDLFQFEDGTSLTYADLVARGFDIDGTDFDDVLFGTNVIDRFRGGLGNDRMEGGEGNDSYVFNIGDGVDTIVDAVAPGADNDIIFGPGIVSSDLRLDLASDQSDAEISDLLIRVGVNGDAVQLDTFDRDVVLDLRTVETFRFDDGSVLTYEQLLARGFDLTGTAGDDQIEGTNVVDRIISGDGADVLQSGLGDDTLDGGTGNDQLSGGQGNDSYLFGPGSGQDTIVEFQGSLDRISMAAGVAPSDVVVTRNNNDLVLSLNGGTDRLTVSFYFLASPLQIEQVIFADGTVWDHAFIENLTRPTINGTGGNDVLVGTGAADQLLGLAGNDQLSGLAGNDVLDGGTGADQLAGGPGNDTYVVDDAGDVVTELVNEGTDLVQSAVSYQLSANVEHLTLTGGGLINGTGNSLDNVLTGNSAVNVLTGGAGNDTYVVGAGDAIVELAGEGTDTIQTGSNATLGANLENLTLTGSAALTGTGNALDNVLQAEGSVSILAGGDGNDTYLIGPNGDDDMLVETATGGIDTVIAAHDYRLPGHIENLTVLDPRVPDFETFSLIPYGSPGIFVSGYGNDLDNTLAGGRANNALDGGLGADTLIGGAGDDTYVVDDVGDIVVERANEGIDTVQSSTSHVLSANVESLTLVGTGTIDGTGNGMNNTLLGNAAANVLDGGVGNDILNGEEGADTFVFGLGSGQDVVADTTQTGAVDTVQIKTGLTPSDLAVFHRGEDLVLNIAGTTDELALANFYGPSEWGFKQVRFVDGTLWDAAELRARAVVAGGTTNGSTGNDNLIGGVGNDTLVGNAGNDTLAGGLGDDVIYGDAISQSPFVPPVIGNDQLTGGSGNDVLRDFQGTNVFDGGAGNDSLLLGAGQDTVLFGRGSGTDFVTLDNNGSDIDVIQIAADLSPADVVISRHYPDYQLIDLYVFSTGDKLTLSLSTNYPSVGLETTQAVVRFTDGTQWNLAWSPSNLSFATGTILNDVISGFPGDIFRGLAGDDTYLVDSASESVVEAAGEGIDTVESLVDYSLGAHVENLILAQSASSVIPSPVHGTGNELDNLIVGNTRNNILDGGDGNDVLVGGVFRSAEEFFVFRTGSDILIGGAGDDVLMADGGNVVFAVGGVEGQWLFLGGGSEFRENVPRRADDLFIGGSGNDTYILHSQQQTVAEFAGEGTDTVQSTVNYVLGEHVENLTLQENPVFYLPGPVVGTGNELNNVLIGNSEDNVLSGMNGDDTLWGGSGINRDSQVIRSGDDVLRGGAGHDTYLFKIGDGIDTIEDVAVISEGNRIQFGVGIAQSDLTFTQDQAARTLTIQVGSSGTDQLVLTNFDPTGANGSLVVETLAFADGSTASLAALLGGPVNHAPTVANALADQTVPEVAPFSIVVPANAFADQDAGDVLTYSATLANGTALPAWLTFDAATRTFSGTPDDAQVGNLDVRVTATDTGNLAVSDQFTLTVTNVNEAPTVAVPVADQQATSGTAFQFVMAAETFADVDAGDVLTYNAVLADGSALPSWLSFDATTRTFSGTPGTGDAGTIDVRVTATDTGALSASDVFALTVSSQDQVLTGTAGNDVLAGGVGNDQLFGLAGSDTLTGGARNDLLDGGTGTDTMTGGSGDDTYVVDATGDGVTELANEGTDTVQTNLLLYTLGANLENLTLTGTGPSAGIGNALSNVLTGNSGANLLDGKAGADQMSGGAGDDLYLVDNPGDTVIEQTGEGTLDSVTSSVSYTLSPNVENLVLTGSAAINGTGNDQDNVLTGNSAANVLTGGAGNDTYVVGSSDTVVEGAGEGTDAVISTVTHSLGANVENLTLLGLSSASATGNVLDNVLNGLLNLGGNTLTGGAGNDTYIIGAGDAVVEVANGGIDTVQSLLTHSLGANVEHLTLAGLGAVNGTGNSLNNTITGNSANNVLSGAGGDDQLRGGLGNDTVNGGSGNDTFLFGRGDGQDLVQDNSGTADKLLYDTGINPLDLVISRQANNLRLAIHDSTDVVTVQNWYVGTTNRTETIQAGNGQTLLSTQVDQLIQAMAAFSAQSGLTWDQAIDQQPQDVQTVLAGSWQ